MSSGDVLKVGIFGGGVVGGGVYELVQKHTQSGKFGKIGANIQISKICVRDLSKRRDFVCQSGMHHIALSLRLLLFQYTSISFSHFHVSVIFPI